LGPGVITAIIHIKETLIKVKGRSIFSYTCMKGL